MIMEKARKFQKNIYLYFIDYAKAFVWITTNCGTFLKRWAYQNTLLVSSETCMQLKKQQLGFLDGPVVKKSGCQYRRLWFHPCSVKIPHAAEPLSLCTATTEPEPQSLEAATAEAQAP